MSQFYTDKPLAKPDQPEAYKPADGLVDAANVALMLGQPLLLTGEAGTGKTQFAYYLAHELNQSEPLRFNTKSTSTAQELFYEFDVLKRYHDLQSGEALEKEQYVKYQALGKAIKEADCLDKRQVVLVDEVDKAPRDFPNNILNEIENWCFEVLETGKLFSIQDQEKQPILVLTSNSEKHLPDAFLRRCAYYHIPFPEKDKLREIVKARLPNFPEDKNLDEQLDLFFTLRDEGSLRKKPATAELLSWLVLLQNTPNALLKGNEWYLSALVKNREDLEVARDLLPA
ncbi:MoxR family ATPase [Candidatus Albibeggiatoa sp. nov. NOAA]|uniref:AAA family ATPase n=1 Tax=Candidatus Albibeggiatoa sp. nov. NOAA TaxID=3162724 RepID=UPI0032F32A61|nr:MoxR family ATPase [Thiotrichaceae bacterium]